MNRTTALTLYTSLMREHGLTVKGWKAKINTRASRRLGCCSYQKKTLDISGWHVDNGTEEAIRDTMLHEIAHAIAGHTAGHGVEWQNVCRRIGAKPQEYADKDDCNTPTWRLAIRHKDGRIEPLKVTRYRRTDMSGRWITGRKEETANRLIWIENIL